MALRSYLILLGLLILASCAQVGTLSGGDQDIVAPVPVKFEPASNQTNFTASSISMTFDEFVQLNNPNQNIFIVPGGVPLQTTLKKKTLNISWGESLLPNTTYVIYLNGAVKDITEGNDSLMTYVFSTGNTIDSLSYSVNVTDAWSGQPLKGMLVGLYTSKQEKLPFYFARTNALGQAQFNNLKQGVYQVSCFADEDKDMLVNNTEKRGFRSGQIQLDSTFVDSLPLRAYNPLKKKVRSFTYNGPGTFQLGAEFPLDQSILKLNGVEIPESDKRQITTDSLQFFADLDTISKAQLIVRHEYGTDTLSLLLNKRDKDQLIKIKAVKQDNTYGPHDKILFELNDQISKVDSSLFTIINKKDTSELRVNNYLITGNLLEIEIDRIPSKDLEIEIASGAIQCRSGKRNELYKSSLQLNSRKDYGSLKVNIPNGEQSYFLELISNSKVVKTIPVQSKSTLIENLSPGEYSFRLIRDTNSNQRWDRGDETIDLQPEKVLNFSTVVKIRANWDAEIELNTAE